MRSPESDKYATYNYLGALISELSTCSSKIIVFSFFGKKVIARTPYGK